MHVSEVEISNFNLMSVNIRSSMNRYNHVDASVVVLQYQFTSVFNYLINKETEIKIPLPTFPLIKCLEPTLMCDAFAQIAV